MATFARKSLGPKQGLEVALVPTLTFLQISIEMIRENIQGRSLRVYLRMLAS